MSSSRTDNPELAHLLRKSYYYAVLFFETNLDVYLEKVREITDTLNGDKSQFDNIFQSVYGSLYLAFYILSRSNGADIEAFDVVAENFR